MKSATHFGFAALFLAMASCCLAAPNEAATDTRSPLDAYRGDTSFLLLKCRLALELNIQVTRLGNEHSSEDDYQGCIREGLSDSRAALDRALKLVRKREAVAALKAVHIAFSSALQGVSPGYDEARISYAQRQQQLKGKLDEAWARFDLEK